MPMRIIYRGYQLILKSRYQRWYLHRCNLGGSLVDKVTITIKYKIKTETIDNKLVVTSICFMVTLVTFKI